MAALDPLSYDVTAGELTCAECGTTVTGLLIPIGAVERPREPGDEVLQIDVEVKPEAATFQPCGHSYTVNLPPPESTADKTEAQVD